MICTNCKRMIQDGQFYQGRGWQAQHVTCPAVEPLLAAFDYVPADSNTAVVEISEPAKRTEKRKGLRKAAAAEGFRWHGPVVEDDGERARRAGKRG